MMSDESMLIEELVYNYAPPSFLALSISSSGSGYSLIRPSSATNFVLEVTTNLATPVVWAAVTNTPQIVGAMFSVPIDASQPC